MDAESDNDVKDDLSWQMHEEVILDTTGEVQEMNLEVDSKDEVYLNEYVAWWCVRY